MVENEFQTSKLTPLTRELLIDTPCEEKSVIKKTVEIHSTISTCISATRRTRIRSRALFEIDHQEQENQFPVSVVSSPPSSRATSIAIGGCTSHTNSVPTVERLKMNNRNNKPMQYSNTNEKVEEQEEEEEDTLIIRKKWKHRLHHLDRQTHISDSRRKGLGSFVPPTSRVLLRSMSTKSDIKSSQQEQEVQQLVLPTVSSSNHPDLNVISPKTVHQLIQGQYKNQLTSYHLIDCRFEFEFQGGSLQEAISMNDPTQMEQFLLERPLNNCTKTALIFFCEFSANRAPKMYV
jgi:hypothetical protein